MSRKAPSHSKSSLRPQQIGRYSRQILVDGIGIKGQERICNAKVLVVGAGGLGCPVIQCLAASGIGTMGIVDFDKVELSNLQRQSLHTMEGARLHFNKAESASIFVRKLNEDVKCLVYPVLLDQGNIYDIVKDFDVCVDCTDNVFTRYMLNDICVYTGIPLVSGGALRWEGQVTTYNSEGGPCLRCIFPVPPPPEATSNCNENGVIGAITGIIGNIQALEVLKLIVGKGNSTEGEVDGEEEFSSSLRGRILLLEGASTTFRSVRVRKRQETCLACGVEGRKLLGKEGLTGVDYIEFCGGGALDKSPNLTILGEEERIDVKSLCELMTDTSSSSSKEEQLKNNLIILDVREQIQYDICCLDESLHIPLKDLPKRIPELQSKRALLSPHDPISVPIYIFCRLGNDSQLAVKLLKEAGFEGVVKDVVGGFKDWSLKIDESFPIY